MVEYEKKKSIYYFLGVISWHIALLCLRKIQYAGFPHPHFCKEKRLLVKPAGVAPPIKILRCSLLQKFEIII
jgi:hypothetical protein